MAGGNWIIYLKDRSFLESNTRDLLKYKTSHVTNLAGEAAAHTASPVALRILFYVLKKKYVKNIFFYNIIW